MLNGNEIAKEQYEHIALYIFISFAPLNSAPTPITSQLTDLLCNAAVRYTKHTIYKLYILQYWMRHIVVLFSLFELHGMCSQLFSHRNTQ